MKKLLKIKDCEFLRMKDAYTTAAKLVVLYGDLYLPIFERVHKEIKKSESSIDLKLLAMKVSQI